MNIIKTEINVGIDAPFTFLHMSDTHLTLADSRDDERKNELAAWRYGVFPCAEENMEFALKYANEKKYMIAHTGDLIDFVSYANLDAAKSFTDSVDCFMAAGNHEFSLYVGEAVEDAAYRNQSLDRVQKSFKNDIRFSCREVNGVNLVAVDNSYYLIDELQLESLKKVADEGKPMLLFMHTPLYTKELYDIGMERSKECAYLMAVPEELMCNYSEDRHKQQLADKTTREAYEYIISQSLIKGIFVGHMHFDYDGFLTPNVPQLMIGCDTLREITVR